MAGNVDVAALPWRLLSLAEAAAALNLAEETVRKKAADGRIGYVREGRKGPMSFTVEQLQEWTRANSHDPVRPAPGPDVAESLPAVASADRDAGARRPSGPMGLSERSAARRRRRAGGAR